MNLLDIYRKSYAVTTDSRAITPGCLFFGLRGERVNGADFARQAIEQGAALAIVDEPGLAGEPGIYVVEDALKALQQLAADYRITWTRPVLAVCGSNGKTTTKELLAAVLSLKFTVFATKGNLNNHIGVPLSLLAVNPDHDFAIIEIGANHIGETAELCDWVRPDMGLVTNNGKDHLEGFGSIEGVRIANSELYTYIRNHTGTVFVNGDHADLMQDSEGLNRVVYGFGAGSSVQARQIQNGMFAGILVDETCKIISRLAGDFNAENLLAAFTIGRYFGMEDNAMRKVLQAYQPSMNRSQMTENGGNLFVMDAYNANPTSMLLALRSFVAISHPHKGVILGDMLEMGGHSAQEHLEILNYLTQHKLEQIVLVGKEFGHYQRDFPFLFFPSVQEATAWYHEQNFEEFLFLLKGSRGIALEKILQA